MKIVTIIIVLLSLSSCKGQEYDHGIYDLNKLTFNLNVGKFYSKSQDRKNIKFTSGKQYVEKDTITEYDLDWNGNRAKIVGFQYNVKGYSPEDSVAVFRDVYFSRMAAMTDENNSLMLVNAVCDIDNNEYGKLIHRLINEYGKPEIATDIRGFVKTKSFTWRLKDRVVKIVSEGEYDFDNQHALLNEKDKEFIKDVHKSTINETLLFICNSNYEKLLLGKLSSGNWSDFK
jgi:hypothetical protein